MFFHLPLHPNQTNNIEIPSQDKRILLKALSVSYKIFLQALNFLLRLKYASNTQHLVQR